MGAHLTTQTQLAHQPDAAKPDMAAFHHINMPCMLKLEELAFDFMWWKFVIIIMKYWLPLNLQLQGQYTNPLIPKREGYVYNIISPWIYSVRIQKTMDKGDHCSTSEICQISSCALKIKFWSLIFWFPQMICSGDVSTSWHRWMPSVVYAFLSSRDL